MANLDKNVEHTTHELCKVLKIPPLWMDHPEIWLFQGKMQFKINWIVWEETKFNYLVSQLEPKYVENIWNIITNNSARNYSEFKTRLLDLFKESKNTRIKKLINGIDLNNLKPNQLPQKLRSGNRCVINRLYFFWRFFVGAIFQLSSHQ